MAEFLGPAASGLGLRSRKLALPLIPRGHTSCKYLLQIGGSMEQGLYTETEQNANGMGQDPKF